MMPGVCPEKTERMPCEDRGRDQSDDKPGHAHDCQLSPEARRKALEHRLPPGP